MINTDWSTNEERAEENSYGGICHYRVLNPAKELRKRGHTVDAVGKRLAPIGEKPKQRKFKNQEEIIQWYIDGFKGYDVIISKSSDSREVTKNMLFVCKRLGIPLVVDYDDNPFNVIPGQPAYEMGYAPGKEPRIMQATLMSLSNALFTSTEPLHNQLSEHIYKACGEWQKFHVLPNCCDPEVWDYPTEKNDKDIVIGWAGSITHDADLKVALPSIRKIMQENDHVYLELMGGVRQESFNDLFKGWGEELDRVKCSAGTKTFVDYPKEFMAKKWDIAVAPLIDDDFNKAKSHIKYMEYAMKELPTVFSKVYCYAEDIQETSVVKDGITGLLAKQGEWYQKLNELVHDKHKRNRIGRAMKKDVLENWTQDKHVHKWEEAIQSVIDTGV